MRALVVIALILGAAGCSGDGNAAGGPVTAPTSSRKARPVLSTGAPLFKMASGTDAVEGVLAEWCEGSKCTKAPGVRPLRYIEGRENGLLLFQASAPPERVTVEVRAAGKLYDRQTLVPGTTIAYGARPLPDGKYRIVLTAGWPKREGRWVFGVAGPLG